MMLIIGVIIGYVFKSAIKVGVDFTINLAKKTWKDCKKDK